MRTPESLVHSSTAAAAATPAASSSSSAPAAMISIDPNMVVILASLLCAFVCLAGLALVTRCACRRRSPSATSITIVSSLPPRGLKKKAIDALPVTAVKEGHQEEQCAICLADLAAGEELRVLPRCGHSFHVTCVDAWLRAHATCPSCRATILESSTSSCSPPARQLAAPGRCQRCGAACEADDKVAASAASAAASSADRDESSFLP